MQIYKIQNKKVWEVQQGFHFSQKYPVYQIFLIFKGESVRKSVF